MTTPHEAVATCSNCIFYFKEEDVPECTLGFCHRYPPNVRVELRCDEEWAHPNVGSSDWCGEHVARSELRQ